MKLLLIRHGQSANNVLTAAGHPFSGRSADPELTDLGVEQSWRLARAFEHGVLPRPEVLISSPMVRAVRTAAPLAETLDLPVIVDTQAYEVGGVYAGRPEVPGRHRGAPAERLAGITPRVVLPQDITGSGWYDGDERIETPAHAQERGRALYASLRERYGSRPGVVALVCHEWITQYLLRAVLGLQNPQGDPDPWFVIANTATSLVETGRPAARPFEGAGTVALWWVNRHDHLDADQVTR